MSVKREQMDHNAGQEQQQERDKAGKKAKISLKIVHFLTFKITGLCARF
jgi:hypothetical protein